MQESLRAVNHANERIIKEITEICNCSKSLHANDVRSGFLLLRAVFLSLYLLQQIWKLLRKIKVVLQTCIQIRKIQWTVTAWRDAHRIKQLPLIISLCGKPGCSCAGIPHEATREWILSNWFLSFRECSGESRSHWVLFCHSVVIGFNQDTSSLAFR